MTKADIKKLDYTLEEETGFKDEIMNIIARTEGGNRVHLQNDEIDSYFYIPTEQVDQQLQNDDRVLGLEHGHEGVKGEDLTRVYTYIPSQVPKLRDDYDHYEADILFPNRFSLDTDIYGGIEIPDEYANNEPQDIPLSEIQDAEVSTETRIMYCDIEVDDRNGFPDEDDGDEEVVSISFYDTFEDIYHAYLFDEDNPDVKVSTEYVDDAQVTVFDDETKMLRAFSNKVNQLQPDVMAGWNFKKFDAMYLISRFDRLQSLDPNDLSPLGSAYNDGFYGGKIKGISVFDMLKAYKNLQFTELDSFSLEDVASEELGIGKLNEEDDKISEMWHDDNEQLLEYNLRDVYLTVALEEAQGIIQFYEEVANFVGGRLTEVIDYSKAADIYVLRIVNDMFAVPSMATVSSNNDEESFEGAEVFDPATEIKDMVSVLDLASLYPMSMKTINAGPRTKDPDGAITAPNGVSFTKEKKSVISDIIDNLLDEREIKKKQRDEHSPGSSLYDKYDAQQRAVKVIMNCFSEDTDVVTLSGIKNIRDVEIGDEVYSINPETHKVEIKEVIDTTKQKNQFNKLKHINTQNTDLKITPNHRMFVENNHRDATSEESFIEHYDNLKSGYTYNIPTHEAYTGDEYNVFDLAVASNEGRLWIDTDMHGRVFRNELPDEVGNELVYSKNRTAFRLDDLSLYEEYRDEITERADDIKIQYDNKHSSIPVTYDIKSWVKLLGWIISEGSFNDVESKNKSFGGQSYRGKSQRISIAQKQSKYRSEIQRLLDVMGINYTKSSSAIEISNSILFNYITDAVSISSENKQIPEYLLTNDIDSNILKHLLSSLIKGDGNTTGDDSYRYSTKSEQLKEDVVRLAVLCGYKPSVSRDSEVWRILINKNKGSFTKSGVETEEHDNYVYCITVEDNHTVMAGRNGNYQWTGNTLYGILGWDRFRLYDEDVAASVTAVGREVIKFTEQKANQKGYEVIYGDTDSIMLEHDDADTIRQVIEEGFELEHYINNEYDDFALQELNVKEHHFEIEFEKIYRKFMQAGKKKRYAGHIVWKEGKETDQIDIVGLEVQRSDYSSKAKELQEDMIDAILKGATKDEVSDMVRDEIEKIKNLEYGLDEIGIPGGIGQAFHKYESKTKQVKGSEYANKYFGEDIQPGDKPKGIYVERVVWDDSEIPQPPQMKDSAYICWMKSNNVPDSTVFDWNKYMDIQVEGPLSRIIECTEWMWEEIITGQDQSGINEFGNGEDASEDELFGDEIQTTPDSNGESKLDQFGEAEEVTFEQHESEEEDDIDEEEEVETGGLEVMNKKEIIEAAKRQ